MIKAWITDYLGALLRFTYYKYVKRKKVIYSNFLTGVNTPRTKVDKALYDNNYGKNRIWCAGFLLILAGILGICFSYYNENSEYTGIIEKTNKRHKYEK